ncbi:hypothetical protein B0H13DRAFT_1940846, partial [Mycena leptocephala]
RVFPRLVSLRPVLMTWPASADNLHAMSMFSHLSHRRCVCYPTSCGLFADSYTDRMSVAQDSGQGDDKEAIVVR